jgi:hypothetical protein
MALCQAFRLCSVGGCVAGGGVGTGGGSSAGAGSLRGGAPVWAEAEKGDKSADKKPPAISMPRMIVRRGRGERTFFTPSHSEGGFGLEMNVAISVSLNDLRVQESGPGRGAMSPLLLSSDSPASKTLTPQNCRRKTEVRSLNEMVKARLR